jgi:hypothetical protein
MQDFYREYTQMMGMPNQYSPMATMPQQYSPMATMPQQQLETMYPNTYNIIQPVVEQTCDKMANMNAPMVSPTQKQLDSMIEDVYSKVEGDVEAAVKLGATGEERQFFGGGRHLLRDFIGALLITSLIRRRHPFYGHHGYGYPGYGYPGYGYPGYGYPGYGGFGGY